MLASAAAFWSCKNFTDTFRTTPHTQYIRSLELAKLDKTTMAQVWMEAAAKALNDSVFVPTPFSESGYFNAHEPAARSYRFIAREGQLITLKASVKSNTKPNLFIDLFTWQDKKWKQVAHGDSTFTLTYEQGNGQDSCLIRIQPELLVTAYYTLALSLTPVLINPVQGATNKSIGSFYGDARDGGKRKHEGVDIFAAKGTLVIAPTDGYVSRVGNNSLGGKVVWMQDPKRGHSYYFAHLDSQLVTPGMKLHRGEPIGLVGNTGNAKYTPSHLHFGIYQSTSKDPVNYIRMMDVVANTLPWDTTFAQLDFKVTSKTAAMMRGPSDKFVKVTSLARESYVHVLAQSKEWYRVTLPDGMEGFVKQNTVKAIHDGKRLKIKQPTNLLSETTMDAVPLAHLSDGATVEVLAFFNEFRFVKTREGVFGWLLIGS